MKNGLRHAYLNQIEPLRLFNRSNDDWMRWKTKANRLDATEIGLDWNEREKQLITHTIFAFDGLISSSFSLRGRSFPLFEQAARAASSLRAIASARTVPNM